MRYFMVFLFLFITTTVHARAILIYKNNTKEVLSLSDKNDAVKPSGHTKVSIPGSRENYPKNIEDYLYVSDSFKLNQAKVDARAAEEQLMNEKGAEKKLIRKRSLKMAYDALVAEGVTFVHVDESYFQ